LLLTIGKPLYKPVSIPTAKGNATTGKLSERSMSRVVAWYMVRRRARDAGIETAIGNHSFRAIGITDYLERGGDINIAKRMAGHSNVKTTELYDRRGVKMLLAQLLQPFGLV
jgi:integrase/recombinase XerD